MFYFNWSLLVLCSKDSSFKVAGKAPLREIAINIKEGSIKRKCYLFCLAQFKVLYLFLR